MNKRSHELSQDALIAWRMLRDEGGYWTAGEVAQALRPNDHPSVASARAARWMCALQRRRFVVVNPAAIRVPAYGVTARCFVPAGESIDAGVCA